MKAYTSLEQSKKLMENLPLESADMDYIPVLNNYGEDYFTVYVWDGHFIEEGWIPCWSLSALLDYLTANFRVEIKYLDNFWELDCRVQVTYNKELVDACVAMLLKLHEQELL